MFVLIVVLILVFIAGFWIGYDLGKQETMEEIKADELRRRRRGF